MIAKFKPQLLTIPMPRKPKSTILTGYQMSRKDFEEFVMSIPSLQCRVSKEEPDFERCALAYHYWRDVLKEVERAPRLKRMSFSGKNFVLICSFN